MSLAVADHSGQAWLQGFNEVGVAIFNMSANELLAIKVRQVLILTFLELIYILNVIGPEPDRIQCYCGASKLQHV
jgi:hypothetical protein